MQELPLISLKVLITFTPLIVIVEPESKPDSATVIPIVAVAISPIINIPELGEKETELMTGVFASIESLLCEIGVA